MKERCTIQGPTSGRTCSMGQHSGKEPFALQPSYGRLAQKMYRRPRGDLWQSQTQAWATTWQHRMRQGARKTHRISSQWELVWKLLKSGGHSSVECVIQEKGDFYATDSVSICKWIFPHFSQLRFLVKMGKWGVWDHAVWWDPAVQVSWVMRVCMLDRPDGRPPPSPTLRWGEDLAESLAKDKVRNL